MAGGFAEKRRLGHRPLPGKGKAGKHDGWVWNLFPIVDGVFIQVHSGESQKGRPRFTPHSTMALQLAAQMKSSHMMGRFESKPWKIVNSESVDLA